MCIPGAPNMADLTNFHERNQAYIKLLEDRRTQHKDRAAQAQHKAAQERTKLRDRILSLRLTPRPQAATCLAGTAVLCDGRQTTDATCKLSPYLGLAAVPGCETGALEPQLWRKGFLEWRRRHNVPPEAKVTLQRTRQWHSSVCVALLICKWPCAGVCGNWCVSRRPKGAGCTGILGEPRPRKPIF